MEIDLRQPSMLHGKKGFERIVWAFKNVLNHAVTWLFFDVGEKTKDLEKESVSSGANRHPSGDAGLPASTDSSTVLPILKHHPITMTCVPEKRELKSLLVPSMKVFPEGDLSLPMDLAEETLELKEWLDLISLNSPRIENEDTIDPFLCRYAMPYGDRAAVTQVVRVRWKGYLPNVWVRQLFLECM